MDIVERMNIVREGMEAGLDDWPIASMIYEYKTAADEIERLRHNLQVTEQTLRNYAELAAQRLEEIERLRKENVDLASLGQRIAMELERLLMDCKWWDSAYEAIEQWRSYEPGNR